MSDQSPPDHSPLDHAQAARTAAPGDAGAEGAFYRLLADATLFLLLEAEAEGEVLTPRVFELADGPVLLAFDSEERLASLGDTPLPYAALPGRVIAAQMAGQGQLRGGLSLGLNLGTGAASEMLLPPAALDWMLERLATNPQQVAAAPESFHPARVPETLIRALRENLAAQPGLAHPGLARAALLAGVRYAGGRRGHLLAVIGADPMAEPALARAVAEALAFSGLDAGEIDVLFLAGTAPLLAALAPQALRLDLPGRTAEPAAPAPTAPGMDRNKPPKLR